MALDDEELAGLVFSAFFWASLSHLPSFPSSLFVFRRWDVGEHENHETPRTFNRQKKWTHTCILPGEDDRRHRRPHLLQHPELHQGSLRPRRRELFLALFVFFCLRSHSAIFVPIIFMKDDNL